MHRIFNRISKSIYYTTRTIEQAVFNHIIISGAIWHIKDYLMQNLI